MKSEPSIYECNFPFEKGGPITRVLVQTGCRIRGEQRKNYAS